jgi:sulfoxide reductase heme-binding subunit YedZ
MQFVLNSKMVAWAILALPGAAMAWSFASGQRDAMEMLHPTGEFAVRWMVLAMMIGPALDVFGPRRWLLWLLARRRWIGVAAFLYGVAHLVFYVLDMGTPGDMLDEIGEHGIWTGWAAFVAMAVPAVTSNDAAMRALRRGWKRLQRLVWPAAILTVLHWGLLTLSWTGAAVHFGPLAVLFILRLARRAKSVPEGVPA